MDPEAWIRSRTRATAARMDRPLQSLWQGYGRIERWRLDGVRAQSVILKVVRPPDGSSIGHARKLRSYAVEAAFYEHLQGLAWSQPRTAALHGHAEVGPERWLLLEDLDASDFSRRCRRLTTPDLHAALDWLAALHGRFLGCELPGLWPRGTYWHLATRTEEWARMPAGPLRDAASTLDAALASCPLQTIVHGDAKPANFCFGSEPGDPVAAVDFQYVGPGIGLVDVAYLVGCMGGRWCALHMEETLEHYFALLHRHAPERAPQAEAAWRPLWPVAWADFARFMVGWSGEDWRDDPTTAAMVRAALAGT